MRIALLFILFTTALPSWGYPCPADLESHESKRALHEWLTRLRGHRMVEGCKIEVTTCDASEPRTDSQVLGELYIIDYRGREAYLPLSIAPTNNPKLRTSLKAYKNSFFYIKWDYHYEPEYGRTESYRLDVRMTKDGMGLRSLDLGTYSTHKALNGPGENRSRWYNCGESFEYN